jgi:hypothetical protein
VRTLHRNKKPFWFCLFEEKIPIVDEYGNDSGEYIVRYGTPTKMSANISPATGYSQTEQFGNLENYDAVIVTDWMNCPIDENSVLFIGKQVAYGEAVTIDYTPRETVLGDDEAVPVTVDVPLYNYVVMRVAKSLNSISIAVRKVDVS